MDVRFCERRDHSRDAPDARAKDLDQKSAPTPERARPPVVFHDTRLTWMSGHLRRAKIQLSSTWCVCFHPNEGRVCRTGGGLQERALNLLFPPGFPREYLPAAHQFFHFSAQRGSIFRTSAEVSLSLLWEGRGVSAEKRKNGTLARCEAAVDYLMRRACSTLATSRPQRCGARTYCSFAYSALASFRTGMSGSASFQSVRKSL